MSNFDKTIQKFLFKSIKLAKTIHKDSLLAKKLIEDLKKTGDFDAIVAQRFDQSKAFKKEATAFARVLLDWNKKYSPLLLTFNAALKITINDFRKIKGLHLEYNEKKINFKFNEEEFIFFIEHEKPREISKFRLTKDQEKRLEKKENKIVKEIVEIISLDLHIRRYLVEIKKLGKKYNLEKNAQIVIDSKNINDKYFIKSLHSIVLWWWCVYRILENLKKITHTAIQLDKKVYKEMSNLFSKEEKKILKQQEINISLKGLLLASKLIFNIIPGAGAISMLMDISESKNLYKDTKNIIKANKN